MGFSHPKHVHKVRENLEPFKRKWLGDRNERSSQINSVFLASEVRDPTGSEASESRKSQRNHSDGEEQV